MALPSREALESVARRAGELALSHFGRVAVERKPDRSLVTRADRDVEAFLVAELTRLLPDAGILGEEGASRPASGPYRLVLDPIDGTSAFVAGLPTWCVCIGVMAGAEPVAGVVHVPCTGETYSAVDGAAFWRDAWLPRLETARAADRFLAVHSKAHLRHRLRYPAKVRSLGSAAYHVALVARGVAEAAIVGRPHLWDIAAPGAILQAVGGRYEYVEGGAVDLGALGDGARSAAYVLAGTPEVLAALRPCLGGA